MDQSKSSERLREQRRRKPPNRKSKAMTSILLPVKSLKSLLPCQPKNKQRMHHLSYQNPLEEDVRESLLLRLPFKMTMPSNPSRLKELLNLNQTSNPSKSRNRHQISNP
jgi:hypothetical protein